MSRMHVCKNLVCCAVTICLAAAAGCAARSSTRSRTVTAPVAVTTASEATTVIPAGTTIVIRANEGISADRAEEGRQYQAEIASDIVNAGGQLIVPQGSRATLTVLNASTGGMVGTSELELALSSINVNGRTYAVSSDAMTQKGGQGIGANERTARNVGGGAAIGALIGAIAGGGEGAAAGAAIGAAAGGTAQVLTRGSAVRVPAETVLTFRLDRPIYLR